MAASRCEDISLRQDLKDLWRLRVVEEFSFRWKLNKEIVLLLNNHVVICTFWIIYWITYFINERSNLIIFFYDLKPDERRPKNKIIHNKC